MDTILEQYQIRKTNKEKTGFIEYIKSRLEKAGYNSERDIMIEEKGVGVFKSRNIVVGDPKTATILLGAHYDTCAVLPFPNLMSPTNPIIFIVSQLVFTMLMLILPAILAVILSLLTNNILDEYYTYLVLLFALLIHMMFGYKNKHTANDNTSGVIAITRILEALPKEMKSKVCVVYFDNEEKGLFGSSFFYKKHKKDVKEKLLYNFDCVGDGKEVVFLSKRKARKDEKYIQLLDILQENVEGHDVGLLIRRMKPMMFASDQVHFKKGVGVCAVRKSPVGRYVARIHTPFDTKCREENIEYLVCAMEKYIERI